MLDDIKKILEISTKGIVVMEDGKPAYVVVPFEDYIENTKNAKGISNNNEEGNNLLNTIKEERDIFDERIPAMENVLKDEAAFNNERIELLKDTNEDDIVVNVKRSEDQKKDIKEIRLEDLPF